AGEWVRRPAPARRARAWRPDTWGAATAAAGGLLRASRRGPRRAAGAAAAGRAPARGRAGLPARHASASRPDRPDSAAKSQESGRVAWAGCAVYQRPSCYNGRMINVSETAASKINELLNEENKAGSGLRVFVQGGGCSGFQYGLMIEENGQGS